MELNLNIAPKRIPYENAGKFKTALSKMLRINTQHPPVPCIAPRFVQALTL